MAFSLFGKQRVLGVDVGSSSIKVLELKEGGKKAYQLLNFGIAPLPADVVVDGSIMDSNVVIEALKNLIKSLNLKTNIAATSVSGTSVLIKKINLPLMSEEELEESIQWEAEQYITNINDVNIDFHILGPAAEEGQMNVLLVGAKKEIINERVQLLTEAGLKPTVVDVDAFAVENAFELNYPINEIDHAVLVNVGASITNINIIKGPVSVFTRDISTGGKSYTEEMQKILKISFDEAESMKVGLTPDTMTPEVANALKGVSDSIANEVKKSIDFLGLTGEQKINGVYLSGGAARTLTLKESMGERTGLPVEIIDPFRNVEYNPKVFDENYIESIKPTATLVLGLALRSK